MLDVRGVHKRYGAVVALRGVDLQVAAGEIVGLVGPNGAGKTSLVSIVAGLRAPDQGTVTIDGHDLARAPHAARRRLGLAPQELGIYPTISVRNNLVLFGELAGLRRRALAQRIDEVAAALGLTDLLSRPGQALSGGQKRRLHTAMAMLHRPALLLLDEPTAGSDIDTREELLAMVRHMADDGAAICYSTHYLPEVESLRASVAVIDRGEVVARAALDDLLAAHAHPAVELVFDGPPPPSLGGVVDGDRLRIDAPDPAATAARTLAALGEEAARLRGIEIIRPTLESVYLSVTGRRYRPDDDPPTPAHGPRRTTVSWHRSLATFKHELRVLRADGASMVTLVLMPLVMIGFLKPMYGGALAGQFGGAGAEYAVPSLTVLFAFFSVSFVGFLFFAEHRFNTWERILASPARPAEIMVDKLAPTFLLVLTQQAVLLGAGVVLFGLRFRGSVAGAVAVLVALALCLTALGTLLAAVLKTDQQLNVVANLGAMVLGGIGGSLVPVALLPGWAQAVAPVAPHYWALRGFRTVTLEGKGFASVLVPVAVLLGVAAVLAALAMARFRFDEPKAVRT